MFYPTICQLNVYNPLIGSNFVLPMHYSAVMIFLLSFGLQLVPLYTLADLH